MVSLVLAAIMAAVGVPGVSLHAQKKPRVNPLIAKLEVGAAALTNTDWTFIDRPD